MPRHNMETHVEVTGETSYKQALQECKSAVSQLRTEQKLIEAQFKNSGDEQQYNANMTDLLQRKLEAQRKVVLAASAAIRELNEKGVSPTNASYVQWQKNLNTSATDLINTQTQLNGFLEKQYQSAHAAKENNEGLKKTSESLEETEESATKAKQALEWVRDTTKQIGKLGGDMNFNALNTAITNMRKIVDPDKENPFLEGLSTAGSRLTAVQQTAKGISGFIGSFLDNPQASIIGVLALVALYTGDLVLNLDELARERKFAWVEDLQSLDAGISEEGIAAIKAGVQRGVKEGIDEADIPETLGREIANGYAGKSYQLVTAGYGTVENVGAAASYTKLYADSLRDEAKAQLEEAIAAESDAIIMANLAGNTEEAVAAQERLNQAQADYQTKLQEIEAQQSEMMAQVSRGSTSSYLLDSGVDVDALNDQLQKMAVYAEVIKGLEEHGDLPSYFTYDEDENVTGLSGYAQRLADMWGLSMGDFQGVNVMGLYDRLIEELGNVSKEAVNGGGVNLMADLFDTWSDAGMLEGLDFSDASGALLAAYRASLLKAAAGDDQTFTRDELLEVLFGDSYQQAGSQAETIGAQAAEGMVSGVNQRLSDVGAVGQQLGDALIDAATTALDEHSPSRVFEDIGGNAAAGLANGIYARSGEAIAAANWLAAQVTNTIRAALQINSPSKVLEQLGEFTGLGFAEGITASTAEVDRAVSRMLDATRRPVTAGGVYGLQAAASRAASQASRAGSAAADTVHVTLTMDEEVVGEIMAPIINEKIGATIAAKRR